MSQAMAMTISSSNSALHPGPMQVGIIGAGDITRLVHLPVLKSYGNVRVAWVADVDPQRVRALGRAFAIDRQIVLNREICLPPCDIVLLATPVHARRPYLEYLATRGSMVLTEKPFAVSEQEHLHFLALSPNNRVSCGYMRRTYATVRTLRRIIEERWFGRLREIRYSEGGRVSGTAGASKTLDLGHRQGGGVLRDLGCHGLDTLLYVTGASRFCVRRAAIEWDEETDRQVAAEFVLSGFNLKEPDECPVEFSVSWLSEQSNTMLYEFDRVRLRTGIQPDAELEIASSVQSDRWTRLSLDLRGARSSYQAFFLEWEDTVEAFRQGRPGELAASNSVLTTGLVDEIYRRGGGR